MGKKKDTGLDPRCSIHILSRRHRLADPDGISGKAAIDGLVAAKLLSNDSAKQVSEVRFSQVKVPKADAEETVITLEWEESV